MWQASLALPSILLDELKPNLIRRHSLKQPVPTGTTQQRLHVSKTRQYARLAHRREVIADMQCGYKLSHHYE